MDIEQINQIIDQKNQEFKTEIENFIDEKLTKLIEKINELEKKPRTTPGRQKKKEAMKNYEFEENFEKCKQANESNSFLYPCFYMPKSGKNKGKCCGIKSTTYINKENETVAIKGIIDKNFYHSLRCDDCQGKGGANSESKKKCTEKIKGINVETTSQVNEKALSFLSGNNASVVSPTKAIPPAGLPTGTEVEYDDYFHYLVPYDGNSFVFEHSKNKSGSPSLKKTPTLRGYIEGDQADEDNYKEMLKDQIPEEIIAKLQKRKKFKFEGKIVKKPKEDPVVPQLEIRNQEESDGEEAIGNSEMDQILAELDVE